MQLYRYNCPECSHTFRRVLSNGDQPQLTCPNCGGVAFQEGADSPSTSSPSIATAAWQQSPDARTPVNGSSNPATVGDACDLDGH